MTKEYLLTYRSKKAEIQELTCKLNELWEGDGLVDNDVIFDYRSGHPIPQAVVGIDFDKGRRMEARYKKRIDLLERECTEIEDFVESIQDSQTRRIFRMRFIDGMSQREIGRTMHLDQSRISRKIDDFFKVA